MKETKRLEKGRAVCSLLIFPSCSCQCYPGSSPPSQWWQLVSRAANNSICSMYTLSNPVLPNPLKDNSLAAPTYQYLPDRGYSRIIFPEPGLLIMLLIYPSKSIVETWSNACTLTSRDVSSDSYTEEVGFIM